MFLEKDWNLVGQPWNRQGCNLNRLEEIFHGINALVQRGVPYIRLGPHVRGVNPQDAKLWHCSAEGVPFLCTTAYQHRWTNTPFVLDCKWFLRYLEPFALLDDPIMYGCREGFQENGYCDWEEALQDGRVAWTNSQWVIAALGGERRKVFEHKEVDQ